MMELDQQCKIAGITVMNEIGLDPGIDHLYALKTIEEVHEAGKQNLGSPQVLTANTQVRVHLRHQQLNPSPKSNTDTAKFKAERLHRFCHTVEGSQLQKIQATRTYLYALTFPSLCISISFLSVPHSVTAYPSVSSLYTFSPSP
jgi:saccharopine dehydrogenase-like NADP-dependent oxidoreductase